MRLTAAARPTAEVERPEQRKSAQLQAGQAGEAQELPVAGLGRCSRWWIFVKEALPDEGCKTQRSDAG